MNNKDFENRLKTTLHKMEDREMTDAMQKTSWNLKVDLHQKTQRERIGFQTFLFMQMKFVGRKVWLCQGLLLVLFSVIFLAADGGYLWKIPAYAARMLCYLAILIAMTALPLIHRSIHYKMHEVETAARFSADRLLAAKLLLIGTGDIFMLAGILIIVSAKTSLPTGSVALYLLFPYLLASSGLLFLLGHLKTERFMPYSLSFYFLLLLLILALKQIYPGFFQQTLSGGWMAVCAGLMVFCIYQIRYLVYRSGFTGVQMS
ncbi:MAG: hypothetical protein Q4F21_13835 [Lachnospiraceae bacterium]|nr:hypothetical protein [Lachnospiraceae bacterium]